MSNIAGQKIDWSPYSWQEKGCPVAQLPQYQDQYSLLCAIESLKNFPPLVSWQKIEELKLRLARAGDGLENVLHLGDCAEVFLDCTLENVSRRAQNLLQMSSLLQNLLGKKTICIGRIAGQYAKPRTEEFEFCGDKRLNCYRGDLVNDRSCTIEARNADPTRLLKAAECSQKTLEWIKQLNFAENLYTSHEALLLHYESALTRPSQESSDFYNFSAHFVWLGERTRQLTGAHVEYLRGIQNPIGIKLSHKITDDELLFLLKILNKENKKGKIMLITRLGCDYVENHLQRLIKTVKKARAAVTWIIDPMHGNSEINTEGFKVRHVEKICFEVLASLRIHRSLNSVCAGLHLETSADDVTECLGFLDPDSSVTHIQAEHYKTACDPRLNPQQTRSLLSRFACAI